MEFDVNRSMFQASSVEFEVFERREGWGTVGELWSLGDVQNVSREVWNELTARTSQEITISTAPILPSGEPNNQSRDDYDNRSQSVGKYVKEDSSHVHLTSIVTVAMSPLDRWRRRPICLVVLVIVSSDQCAESVVASWYSVRMPVSAAVFCKCWTEHIKRKKLINNITSPMKLHRWNLYNFVVLDNLTIEDLEAADLHRMSWEGCRYRMAIRVRLRQVSVLFHFSCYLAIRSANM